VISRCNRLFVGGWHLNSGVHVVCTDHSKDSWVPLLGAFLMQGGSPHIGLVLVMSGCRYTRTDTKAYRQGMAAASNGYGISPYYRGFFCLMDYLQVTASKSWFFVNGHQSISYDPWIFILFLKYPMQGSRMNGQNFVRILFKQPSFTAWVDDFRYFTWGYWRVWIGRENLIFQICLGSLRLDLGESRLCKVVFGFDSCPLVDLQIKHFWLSVSRATLED
jgi:hypothetical protein